MLLGELGVQDKPGGELALSALQPQNNGGGGGGKSMDDEVWRI